MATNRPQGDAQGRIQCPNCHANNFVGPPQCWQCGAPLSSAGAVRPQQAVRPPAAPHPLPAASPGQPPPSSAFARAAERPHPLLLIGIAMLAFVAVLFVVRARSASSLPSAPPGREVQETLRPNPDLSAQSAPNNSPDAGAVDPVEEAARRAISREAPNIGLPPPPTVSPDGKVHLRTGGAISPDEWNEARRKLQGNPLLKEPPLPPPF